MSKPQFASVPVTLDFKVEPWSISKFDSPEFVDEWRKHPHTLTIYRITSDGDIAPISERGDSTTLFVHTVFTARNYEVTKGNRLMHNEGCTLTTISVPNNRAMCFQAGVKLRLKRPEYSELEAL